MGKEYCAVPRKMKKTIPFFRVWVYNTKWYFSSKSLPGGGRKESRIEIPF
jgi:hypothetical protein